MKLSLVVPCYNEELVVKSTVETLLGVLDSIIAKGKISDESYVGARIYLVDTVRVPD